METSALAPNAQPKSTQSPRDINTGPTLRDKIQEARSKELFVLDSVNVGSRASGARAKKGYLFITLSKGLDKRAFHPVFQNAI